MKQSIEHALYKYTKKIKIFLICTLNPVTTPTIRKISISITSITGATATHHPCCSTVYLIHLTICPIKIPHDCDVERILYYNAYTSKLSDVCRFWFIGYREQFYLDTHLSLI